MSASLLPKTQALLARSAFSQEFDEVLNLAAD